MLLKHADDKSKRLALLEDLQKSPKLDSFQKKWLRDELSRLRKGIQGERDSAYFLDQYFKDGENHVVLHDLRFVVDEDVAQIDHLVINRGAGIYLIETKNYAGSIAINAHGEFTAQYDDDRFGVPSPIEQSRRHERILRRLLERLEIRSRTGGPIECYHVVMFHPKAIITRPAASEFDTTNVIKADQFPSWHARFVEKEFGVGKFLRVAANLRSLDTIKEWGEKLMRQHRPANLMELPEFMQPKTVPVPASASAAARSVVSPAPIPLRAVAAPGAGAETARPLVCLHCHSKISYPEARFCWNWSARFGGGQYCREHQELFPRTPQQG
ncbi:MAG: nuclease-related domain-containing protein [Pseudomonadota bacterium]